ncbi:MAG: N-acetylmuramic acid 6-phosphate etherase [Eubacteriales bacterium]
MEDYQSLKTESPLEASENIDSLSSLGIVKIMNDEDKKVAFAVENSLPDIARAVDLLAEALKNGGRIFYCGAGTSGRLGVLDASECPPTFGVSPETVQGIIAGGKEAAFSSIEDAEDLDDSIVTQLVERKFDKNDACVAISASGSAACVKGALAFAGGLGAKTIAVTNNVNADFSALAQVTITIPVGGEVIKGSTRLKAGTSQKMVLNMLSTGAMIKYGRTLGNLMAYMVPSNKKLVARAVKMITETTGCTEETALAELKQNGMVPAKAIQALRKK